MKNVMTLVDDIKDSIPEGKYLELCNTIKKVFDNKPSPPVREWKTFKFDKDEVKIDIMSNKDSYIPIVIDAIHMLPHRFVDGVFEPVQYEVSIKGRVPVRFTLNNFKSYLKRRINMNLYKRIDYTYPVDDDASDKTLYNTCFQSFDYETEIKKMYDMRMIELTLKEHADDEINDEDHEFINSIIYESEERFSNRIVYMIGDDLEAYMRQRF